MLITKGKTNVSAFVRLVDSSTEAEETAYDVTDLSVGYVRQGAAGVSPVSVTALSAVTDAHADNKAIEVSASNYPGIYRVDFPDLAFATGADSVVLSVTGSGVKPVYIPVQLVAPDLADGVRLGLTALPNAIPAGSGGLPTVDGSNHVAGVVAGVNASEINGSATAAATLALSMAGIVTGTVSDAVAIPTTTEVRADDITEATADHFKGGTVAFLSGALQGQRAEITGYTLTSGEGVFTVTALTDAPADGDTFVIL